MVRSRVGIPCFLFQENLLVQLKLRQVGEVLLLVIAGYVMQGRA